MPATKETKDLVQIAAKVAMDKLGENVVALDVTEPFALAEVFLVVSATNDVKPRQLLMRLRMSFWSVKSRLDSERVGKPGAGSCWILVT